MKYEEQKEHISSYDDYTFDMGRGLSFPLVAVGHTVYIDLRKHGTSTSTQ